MCIRDSVLHPGGIALADLVTCIQCHAAQRGALDGRSPRFDEAGPVLSARECGQPILAEAAAHRVIRVRAQEGLGFLGREHVDVAAQACVVGPCSGRLALDAGAGRRVQLAATGGIDRGLQRGIAACLRIGRGGAAGIGLDGVA